jgi:hypothetical protein
MDFTGDETILKLRNPCGSHSAVVLSRYVPH